ncbi:hypothetical protein LINGRAHAP2_LOCUS22059 [Linum grandiflorum]
MACWSAENATNAYLKTLKMGQKVKEPEAAEFISALAAGNNSQLMVIAASASSPSATSSTLVALVAAAYQTGGRVICIHPNQDEETIMSSIGLELGCHVEFVTGPAQELLTAQYSHADFVVVDCRLDDHERVLEAVQNGRGIILNGVVVVGYNAGSTSDKGYSWCSSGWKTQLLPIGEGLLVTRMAPPARKSPVVGGGGGCSSKSRWVVKVDECTGEEHVFRVRFPQGKRIIEA